MSDDRQGQAPDDRTADAARRSKDRDEMGRRAPEPPLATRLGQIGVLGWIIVGPMLLGTWVGRLADRHFGTDIFFTAPLIMIGAGIGLWSAWKWMHRQ